MPFFQAIPFFRLLRIARKNGGIQGKGWIHLFPWLVKTLFLEPLRWVELLVYSRRIRKEVINEAPVFILGHYRSGTTYLQRLFMQDDRFGYTSLFQTVLPEIMLITENFLTPFLDKISRVLRLRNHFHRIPLQWKCFPGEEDVGMTALLRPTGSQWGLLFPERMNYYQDQFILFEGDPGFKKAWKADYLYYLKKLSVKNGSRPLVLKNPPNTARIKILLQLFPKARFIHIMRNPLEVITSTRNLRQVIHEHYQLGKDSWWQNGEAVLEQYTAIMKQYLAQKDLIPPGQLVEISYEQFVKAPVESLCMIYRELKLPEFSYCEEKMHEFVLQQRGYKVLHHETAYSSEWYLKLQEFTRYWKNLFPEKDLLLNGKDHTRTG